MEATLAIAVRSGPRSVRAISEQSSIMFNARVVSWGRATAVPESGSLQIIQDPPALRSVSYGDLEESFDFLVWKSYDW